MLLATADECTHLINSVQVGIMSQLYPSSTDVGLSVHHRWCNWPRASPALVSTGTGHYDVCFVLPSIVPCTISFGAAACSLTHSLSLYHCPISCSMYCIGMMCGGPCSALDY